CIGLISFTCDNAVSKLTITFGDVYLANSEQYAAKLTGAYVADDSNVLEFTADEACTSLDLTSVTDFPAELPWLEGTNRVAYVAESSALAADNVVKGAVCQNLKLSADGGDFRPATAFTANQASMTVNIEGARLLMLPFAANVPAGVKAYILADDQTLQEVTEISAHQPVLVEATGAITFTGSGDVSYAASPMTNLLRGTYVQIPLYTGDYVLGQKEGQWGLVRQTATSTLAPFDVYAQVDSSDSFIPLGLTATGIVDLTTETLSDAVYYDVQGRRLKNLEDVQKGQIILIRKGGLVIKMMK
ncbi:MAG: hypothetical protein J6T00_05635, partial [Bacteroidaceae bacterium]|nr:hypothetical protein [Bacteroidaceae bacterium]